MNTIYYKVRPAVLGLCAVALATSCSDFLEIKPQNEVVLEDFWTNKEDASSVLGSCYEQFAAADNMKRMGFWGEVRSDNVITGSAVSYDDQELLKENLLPSNSICSWASMYKTINYCNTLIHYAPGVQEADPNYTYAEMKANVAEATALRSLTYFYLIRTFRDVPFTREPSLTDDQTYRLPATSFEDVLAGIIADLEAVKDDAVRRFAMDEYPFRGDGANNEDIQKNTSRITRWAIYAMLADMYLWQGNYTKSIEYCDLVINEKRRQWDEYKDLYGEPTNAQLFGDIPLLREQPLGSTTAGSAYEQIFGEGNSFESLFEIKFKRGQHSNDYVGDYYGISNDGHFAAPSFLRENVVEGTNKVFTNKLDCRAQEFINVAGGTSQKYPIRKYVNSSVSFNITGSISKQDDMKLNSRKRSDNNVNWIIYRLTDIMLIKAEAEIMLGEERYPAAFALINAVNKRAIDATTTSRSDTLKYANFSNTKEDMEQLLLDERERELMYEGKRWFDLVRFAKRDGDNTRLVQAVTRKYTDNVAALTVKMKEPGRIWYPYSRDELKLNPMLRQNTAYETESSEINR